MSLTVRENDVDLEALATLPKRARMDAYTHLTFARSALTPLRRGFSEGTLPEILRAIKIAIDALEDSLEND